MARDRAEDDQGLELEPIPMQWQAAEPGPERVVGARRAAAFAVGSSLLALMVGIAVGRTVEQREPLASGTTTSSAGNVAPLPSFGRSGRGRLNLPYYVPTVPRGSTVTAVRGTLVPRTTGTWRPAVTSWQGPAPCTADLPMPVAAACIDLSARLSVDVRRISVVEATSVRWPDSCLGLRDPATVCLSAVAAGYVVRLSVDGREYRYHTNDRDTVRSAG